MSTNFLAGKGAAVLDGTTSYSFDEVNVDMKNGLSKTTNFNSSGYATYIGGITDAKISLSGPYDEGNMAFTVGSSYPLVVSYTTGVSLAVTCLLEGISPAIKVEDAIRVKLNFQQTGPFTASIT